MPPRRRLESPSQVARAPAYARNDKHSRSRRAGQDDRAGRGQDDRAQSRRARGSGRSRPAAREGQDDGATRVGVRPITPGVGGQDDRTGRGGQTDHAARSTSCDRPDPARSPSFVLTPRDRTTTATILSDGSAPIPRRLALARDPPPGTGGGTPPARRPRQRSISGGPSRSKVRVRTAGSGIRAILLACRPLLRPPPTSRPRPS